jgi:hypothetical protein
VNQFSPVTRDDVLVSILAGAIFTTQHTKSTKFLVDRVSTESSSSRVDTGVSQNSTEKYFLIFTSLCWRSSSDRFMVASDSSSRSGNGGEAEYGSEEKRQEEGRQKEEVAFVPQLRASLEMRNLVSPVTPARSVPSVEFGP